MTEHQELSTYPVRPVVKPTNPQRNATLEQTQLTEDFPETDDRKDRIKHNKKTIGLVQMTVLKLHPKIQTRNATSSIRSCIWQTKDH